MNMMQPAEMTDEQLNAAVAVEVMGWERRDHGEGPVGWDVTNEHGTYLSFNWSPATDYAAAFEVLERMRKLNAPYWQRFVDALIEWVHGVDPGDSEVGFFFDPTSFLLYYITPRAICEAALKAKRNET